MFAYKYTYLILGLSFFIVWLILFLWRKDTRRQMIEMSLIVAFAGPTADILSIKDWWHPLTLTNTGIGFESFIVGFMIGGIATVLYEDIFRKKVKEHKKSKKVKRMDNFNFLFLLILSVALYFGSYYTFHLNSLWAIIIATVVPTLVMWLHRTDLIISSFITAMLLVYVAIIVYELVNLITPGWVQEFWYFQNTPRIMVFSLPIDDIIWYSTVGLFFGPLYEYWKEARFESYKS